MMPASPVNAPTDSSHNYLIRGSDYLAAHPGFKLEGRKEELVDLANKFLRADSKNILLVGPGGVGCASLALGLQQSKDDPDAPFDIVNKRLFWLDTDGLFSSGDIARINESFERILATLTKQPGTILNIEDTKNFLDSARNSGCTHLVNALLRQARNGNLRLVLKAEENDLDAVLKAHPDMLKVFTIHDVKEPKPEALREMAFAHKERLEKIHGITISEEAIDTAIDLTTRYRVHNDLNLGRAQPARTIALLDRSLASYRQRAHSHPPQLEKLETRLTAIKGATAPDLAGKSKEDIELLRVTTETEIAAFKKSWETQQKELREIYRNQRNGEEKLRTLEDQIADQKNREKKEIDEAEAALHLQGSDKANEALKILKNKRETLGDSDSEAIKTLRQTSEKIQEILDRDGKKYEEITSGINKSLQLGNIQVLETFSKISGIAANKLTQDEREKLLSLEGELSKRVFSQDEAVSKVAKAARTSSTVLKKPNKPRGAFIFLGPSGTGKTELSTVFNEVMYGDKESLLTIAMGEYKEKHAIAKLIGAPPGYEGFKAGGGILPQKLRENPRRSIIFDEAEKAEPEIFDVLMQVIDKGEIIDNVGRPVSFKEATIFLTSNIGAEYFLDPDLSFEEAKTLALEALGKKFRPEFLNRFQGRKNIVCFNRLEMPTIERIARREVAALNAEIQVQGLRLNIPDESLVTMCKDHYQPNYGARGITGYFEDAVSSQISEILLKAPDAKGIIEGRYLPDSKIVEIAPPANSNAATVPKPA